MRIFAGLICGLICLAYVVQYIFTEYFTLILHNREDHVTKYQKRTAVYQECNVGFKSTSLEQYRHYRLLKNRTGEDLMSRKDLNNWHIKQNGNFGIDVSLKEMNNGVFVNVLIIDKNTSSVGGASFKLSFQGSQFMVSFSIKDNFDGSYYGCYVLPFDCFKLTIKLLFLKYAAYFDRPPCPLQNLLYKNHMCPLKTEQQRVLKFCKRYKNISGMHGMWIFNKNLLNSSVTYQKIKRENGTINKHETPHYLNKYRRFVQNKCHAHLAHLSAYSWLWKDLEQGCVIPQNNLKDSWQQCLQRYSSVHFIGDSHTRGIFSYVTNYAMNVSPILERDTGKELQMLLNTYSTSSEQKIIDEVMDRDTKRKFSTRSSGNLHFKPITFISGLITQMNDFLLHSFGNRTHKEKINQEMSLVLFAFGSWDLQFHNISYLMNNFHILNETIKKMAHYSRLFNIKWIFSSLPSTWDSSCFCHGWEGHKKIPNYFQTGGVSNFVISSMKELGLEFEVFDYYSLTVHRNNELADKFHYLHTWGDYSIVGNVGLAAMDILLKVFCPY